MFSPKMWQSLPKQAQLLQSPSSSLIFISLTTGVVAEWSVTRPLLGLVASCGSYWQLGSPGQLWPSGPFRAMTQDHPLPNRRETCFWGDISYISLAVHCLVKGAGSCSPRWSWYRPHSLVTRVSLTFARIENSRLGNAGSARCSATSRTCGTSTGGWCSRGWRRPSEMLRSWGLEFSPKFNLEDCHTNENSCFKRPHKSKR